ncbi:hypothetical protein QQ045_017156 [Rhodiola kirilowii]
MASCFSDYAVSIADTSCSSYANNACISPNMTPSVQNAVTSVYKITLSDSNQLQVEVCWNKCQMNQGLSITFMNSGTPSFKLNTSSGLWRKLKGSRMVESNIFKIQVFWDLSMCKYQSGAAEPADGYYVIVMVDSEVGLVLGDLGEEAAKRKVKKDRTIAKSTLTLRREYWSGNTLYATKAKFSDLGALHEIAIRCSGEESLKHPFLSICIDKKVVIRVKRLDWNFRGNQTLFLEGLLVDLLWDVHDWFFNPYTGSGVFMFRRRSGMDRRLWLEEGDVLGKEHDRGEFSLLMYACKNI